MYYNIPSDYYSVWHMEHITINLFGWILNGLTSRCLVTPRRQHHWLMKGERLTKSQKKGTTKLGSQVRSGWNYNITGTGIKLTRNLIWVRARMSESELQGLPLLRSQGKSSKVIFLWDVSQDILTQLVLFTHIILKLLGTKCPLENIKSNGL